MTRKQINIIVLGGMATVIAGMMLQDNLTKGRSGWPQTVSVRGSVDVSPDIDRPSALTIEGSYDEQGTMDNVDSIGPRKQRERLGTCSRNLLDPSGGQAGAEGPNSGWVSIPRSEGDYILTIDYFHYRESRCGKDESWKIPGPAGEEGEYGITPIFIAEVKRLSGYVIDVFDNESCRYGITIWLGYWAPRVFPKGYTIGELYEMYRHGPKGYRDWLERKAAGQ